MRKVFSIIRWILSVTMLICMLGCGFHISALLCLVAGLIIMPIKPIQELLKKLKLKSWLAILLSVVLFFTGILISPSADIPDNTFGGDASISATTDGMQSTNDDEKPTSNTEATDNTESTDQTESSHPTTEDPATAPTTAPTTEPTTEPASEPATTPTTEPPHVHSFSAATCTAPKTCSCGATEGGLADHSWTAATCTAPQKCRTCSAENGSVIGHNYSQGTCLMCGSKDPDYVEITYVLNTYTMKFHKPSCHKLPTDNRKDTTMSREEVVAAGYDACGICHP